MPLLLSDPIPQWKWTLHRLFSTHQMPHYTLCFTDCSWTEAVPAVHQFTQEVSSVEHAATAGLFYCADSAEETAPYGCHTHMQRKRNLCSLCILMKLIGFLCHTLAFSKYIESPWRVILDCAAATIIPTEQGKSTHILSRSHSLITMELHTHMPQTVKFDFPAYVLVLELVSNCRLARVAGY